MPRVLGVRVDDITMAQTLDGIAALIARHRANPDRPTAQLITLNPEMVMAARADPALRALIEGAALVVPDGIGVVWAARWRGWHLRERVTGIDLLAALAERAALRGWRILLLGGAPGVAEAAARELRAHHPSLIVSATHAGRSEPAADAWITGRARASGADIVCVAFGVPAQEYWIARNQARMGAAVALGIGGALDMLAGRVPRAPCWMRHLGLEWAFRLWREPWRWRRMLALPRFVAAVLRADHPRPLAPWDRSSTA